MHKHIGSNFENFLAEEGISEEATATALKRVISWKLSSHEGPKRSVTMNRACTVIHVTALSRGRAFPTPATMYKSSATKDHNDQYNNHCFHGYFST